MKTLSLFFASLTFAVCLAQADVIIEQKVESAMMSGPTTTKIKGDMMRVDSDMPGMGKVTTILDLTKGKSTMLMHSSKMAMQMDLNALKKKAQAVSTGTEKPKPTGQKEKVGDWNTEVYEMKTGEMPVKLWLTKDLPNSAALKEQMNKLTKAAAMGVDPAQFDLPGIVVKSEMTTTAGKFTTTMTSVKEAPVADSEFAIPADYQAMEMPGGLGGAGAAPGK